MQRRKFLKTAALGAALAIAPHAETATPAPNGPGGASSPALKGFIVSDAHFGWRDPGQPQPEIIRQAMQTILRRFPDLGLFVDTGDAHHNDAGDAARGAWTEIIAGGCGPRPLLYCMGNHEHAGAEDTEARSCRLGSLSLRPYQSWTIQGIHFVAAPQMINACYVSEELLDWLELHLKVHRDQTTIIFSHNALKGTTTSGFDLGYRQVVNSPRVLDLLRRHRQVKAWMHGHNHTWELARAFDRFFVSNGRIGGFDPGGPGGSGRGHLGGIYFEITRDALTVRGYSATRDAFFDEFDPASRHMHQRLALATTLDPGAAATVCYGMGRARDGLRVPVYRHHAGADGVRREVFLAGTASPVMNENADFSLATQRVAAEHGVQQPAARILPGFNITPNLGGRGKPDPTWTWENPGLKLLALEGPGARRTIQVPGGQAGSFQYYRCAPGTRLRVEVEAHSAQPGPRLQLACIVFDSAGRRHASLEGPKWTLEASASAPPLAHEFTLPAAGADAGIYRDADSDLQIQVCVEATVEDLRSAVTMRRLAVRFAEAGAAPGGAALAMDELRAAAPAEALAGGGVHRTEWPAAGAARSVAGVAAGGNRLLTWLVRETGLCWQVRNAPAVMRQGWLEIGRPRNTFSPRQEVFIAPLAHAPECFVHRLRRVNRARIRPAEAGRRTVEVELGELAGPAEIELRMPARPSRVEGAEQWQFEHGRLLLRRSTAGTIRVGV